MSFQFDRIDERKIQMKELETSLLEHIETGLLSLRIAGNRQDSKSVIVLSNLLHNVPRIIREGCSSDDIIILLRYKPSDEPDLAPIHSYAMTQSLARVKTVFDREEKRGRS